MEHSWEPSVHGILKLSVEWSEMKPMFEVSTFYYKWFTQKVNDNFINGLLLIGNMMCYQIQTQVVNWFLY